MTRGRFSYTVTKMMSPEVGKWVTVNVKGNSHHEARILISPYTMRQFENLLSHLTDKLKPPFGAVWRLFTEDGVEIRDLEEIKGGQTYIASGRARPMFPVRAKGRGRRESAGRERELRSHSAVGSLGGEARQPRQPAGHALDAASDTNVKHKQGVSAGTRSAAQPRPSRPAPAPRRGKSARARGVGEEGECAGHVWDGPLHSQQHNHYQQPVPMTKRKSSASKKHYLEDYEHEEDLGRLEDTADKSPVTSNNTKIGMSRRPL